MGENVTAQRGKWIGLAALAGAMSCGLYAASAAYAETAAPAAALSKDEADSLIYERQQAMIQLEKDADLIGSIVAGEVPPDKLAETARSLAAGAKDSAELFKREVPGGNAKPEVWTQHADYAARMDKFVAKSAEMAKVAETGNVNSVIELLVDAMPCKECHDVYRIPKKKPEA